MSERDGGHLVAFDLGGVLVRICGDWRQGCAAAGVSPRGVPELSDHDRFKGLVSRHQRGVLDHDEFCAEVSACLGATLSPGEVAAVHDAWILGEFEGVRELLDRIADHGHCTGCLSNTDAPHWAVLQGMPFFGGLHHRHASHLLGLEKPDPAIFEAFERHTGFRGDRIAYFDDLPDNCRAAEAAGWRVRRVDPSRETVPQMLEALRDWNLMP